MSTRRHEVAVDVDESRLAGTLLMPGSTVPGVLFVHGWGGCQQHDLDKAQRLAALGCICLTFDLRGHEGTEEMRQTVSREQNLRDVVAAYDLLVNQPHVDRSAIAVVGASYGGYLAALLSELRPVKWLGLRVPALYKDADWSEPKRSLDRAELIAYRSHPVAAEDNRALRACSVFHGDVLVVQSEHDDLIAPATIVSYRNAFRQACSLTYRTIKGADHALSSDACRQAYMSLLLSWMTEMVFGARAGGRSA